MACRFSTEEMPQACITGRSRCATGRAPLRFGLIEHLRDGGAGKNVVELMKEQNRPGPVLPLPAQQCRHQIGFPQQTLQGSVMAFLIGA